LLLPLDFLAISSKFGSSDFCNKRWGNFWSNSEGFMLMLIDYPFAIIICTFTLSAFWLLFIISSSFCISFISIGLSEFWRSLFKFWSMWDLAPDLIDLEFVSSYLLIRFYVFMESANKSDSIDPWWSTFFLRAGFEKLSRYP